MSLRLDTATKLDRRSPSPTASSSPKSLRILLVDDNQINLSVLSTLLKRRFDYVLAKAPVSLDSGLKALQLLRTEVFDLIFMDIDMPYLDGVECARRIRSAEDGILEANRDAHIIAVTTNIGDEPELLYRDTDMDGMIGKPVRFDQFQQYLCPLAFEAKLALQSMSPIWTGNGDIMPPMPPVGRNRRLFFKPTIAHSNQALDDPNARSVSFADQLKAQTRDSLRNRRSRNTARASTVFEPRRSSFNDYEQPSGRPTILQHSATKPNETTFQAMIDKEILGLEPASTSTSGRASPLLRPPVFHHLSSPAYLLDASPMNRLNGQNNAAARSSPDLAKVPRSIASRPPIHPLAGAWSVSSRSRGRMVENGEDSLEYSSTLGGSQSSQIFPGLSTFTSGDESSAFTTPQSSPSAVSFAAEDRSLAVFSPFEEDMNFPAPRSPTFEPLTPPVFLNEHRKGIYTSAFSSDQLTACLNKVHLGKGDSPPTIFTTSPTTGSPPPRSACY